MPVTYWHYWRENIGQLDFTALKEIKWSSFVHTITYYAILYLIRNNMCDTIPLFEKGHMGYSGCACSS